MKKIISLVLIFTFGLSSCEKDDICDANTPTTPRLVIEFYNFNTPLVLRDVVNLKIVGKGKSETDGGIVFNEGATGQAQYLANTSKVYIPLKVDENSTTFSFIYDANNTNPAVKNTDEITFHYTRDNVYVSRACGFKTIFALKTTSPDSPYVLTDPTGDGFWIRRIIVQQPNIDNENETHVKIYF